jgi:iron complex outermembrane receptor protein
MVFLLFMMITIFAEAQVADTSVQLKEFEVTDYKGHGIYEPSEEIQQSAINQMAAKDIGDMLRSQANVSGIRKGGTGLDPVIRGFKFGQLNVQVNEGQKIESACPNRMDPPTAHIDVDDLQKVEIFKGPYALRFGPNFGGVVHLHTWPVIRTEKFAAHVKAATGYESAWQGMKQHLSVSGGNRLFLIRLSGNYKKYGDYHDGNGNIVSSSFERYNMNGLLCINPWEKNTFSLNYDFAVGENLDFPALPMDERLDKTNLYSFDYLYDNPQQLIRSIHIKAYRSDVNHEMDNKQRPVSDTVVAISTINAVNSGYRAEISLGILGGNLHAGNDMEIINKDGERVKNMVMQPTLPVKSEKLWDNAYIRNFGFFAEFSRSIKRFTSVAAIRFDLNSATSNPLSWENMQGQAVYYEEDVNSSYANLSFSLGADWLLRKNVSLGLSAGRGVRSPDMTERYIILLPIGYDNYDYLGNPGLLPEKNHQADISLKWTIPVAGMIKGTVFYSYITDYISGEMVPESVVKPQTAGVYGVKQFVNLDEVWLAGFELMYHSPVKNTWLLEATAGYTYAVNPLATSYIIENGEVTGSEEVKNDPLYEIPPPEGSLRFSWKFFNGSLVPQVNLRAVAMQNRVSRAYEEKTSPGFMLAGISLFYRFNEALEVSAGVDNLFDNAYYEHLNRTMIGTREDYYEPGRNVYITLRFEL